MVGSLGGRPRCAAWDTPPVDAVALAGVIVAGVGGASTGINAFYNTRRAAKTAQEGRAEQRAAQASKHPSMVPPPP
jgi:hypothetical protein